ncbi:MAG: TPR end-of-group domain-containing protein, partial [Pyrinomonadaceae bacterium]
SIASVYALEDQPTEAFEWLGRAIALGNENTPCFQGDPNWASLRSDPRFSDLMSKVHPGRKAKSVEAPPAAF